MNVAEFFVKIGLKGADGVARGLKSTKDGMSDLSTASLEAKAAVLAVVYGLDRLTNNASQRGMDLKKFSLSTDVSTDALQRWQYQARKFDVSGEEMQGTVMGLNRTISDMLLNKSVPDGARQLGIHMTRDPLNMLEQLANAAKRFPPGLASNLMKSFGISDNVFQMLRAMKTEDLMKTPKWAIMGTGEIDNLARVNSAWKDFWFTLQRIGETQVSKHGMQAISALNNSLKFVTSTADNLDKLTKAFPVLQDIAVAAGIAIAASFAPLTAAIAGTIYLLSEVEKYREGKESVFGNDPNKNGPRAPNKLDGVMGYVTGDDFGDKIKNIIFEGWGKKPGVPTARTIPLPAMGKSEQHHHKEVQFNIQQTIDARGNLEEPAKQIQKHITHAALQIKRGG